MSSCLFCVGQCVGPQVNALVFEFGGVSVPRFFTLCVYLFIR